MEPAFPFLFGTDARPPPELFALILVEGGVLQVQWIDATRALPSGSLLFVPPCAGARIARRADTTLIGCAFGRSLVDPLRFGTAVVEPGPIIDWLSLPPQSFLEASPVLSIQILVGQAVHHFLHDNLC